MTDNNEKFDSASVKERAKRKLERDMGADLLAALHDPKTVEVMLNADGRLWQERLGEPMKCIGSMRVPQAQAIIETIAGYHGKEVTRHGWSFPFEPDEWKDQFEGSYNAGVGIAHLLPPGEAGYGEISLMVNYYNFSFNETDFRRKYGVPSSATVYGYEGDVYTGMVQFRGAYGKMNEGVAPYFTAAFGLYHIALPALGVEGQPDPIH